MVNAVKRRRYESPVRQEQAAQTRARIVAAAGDLFERTGYARTSIRQIADEASVAPDTVYATFGSKPRVLTAVIDERLRGGHGVGNVMERPDVLAVRDEPDQRRQIELIGTSLSHIVEQVGPVFEMMRAAAAVEPAMADVYAEMQGYRLRNMRVAIGWLRARGPLRVPDEEAAETLWTLAAPDTARLLRHQRGWSRERYAAWLSDTLARTLLP
jgi:AcrR family transcriptional regulator